MRGECSFATQKLLALNIDPSPMKYEELNIFQQSYYTFFFSLRVYTKHLKVVARLFYPGARFVSKMSMG